MGTDTLKQETEGKSQINSKYKIFVTNKIFVSNKDYGILSNKITTYIHTYIYTHIKKTNIVQKKKKEKKVEEVDLESKE